MVQSLYLDLADDPQIPPQTIHLGFRLGTNHLRDYLKSLEEIGVNHVALNLRFNQVDTEETLKREKTGDRPLFIVFKYYCAKLCFAKTVVCLLFL